ncbi:TDP-N-acetylfucosamine:lipid II N-acetylfucosaminyltransferase [Providencia huaxiensis]|uniref:TDP-N-acetylfucosamine:lipid II N-acetylfucosaminyltransferase n=1 Tax=Providencia huaxiensis TaxID=2027290 RepID=UPI0034DD48EE
MKILHITGVDKFIPGFIEILEENFDKGIHTVITFGELKTNIFDKLKVKNFPTLRNFSTLFFIIKELNKYDKIILHGLFLKPIIVLLCLMPWLHKKCYWIIWGGDLYCHEQSNKNLKFKIIEVFRKYLICRLNGLITYIDGDYEKAKKWYGARGKLYKCIMYKSNIYSGKYLTLNDEEYFTKSSSEKLNILIGNSATPTNNHRLIFEKLSTLNFNESINKIYCPLSYGDADYAMNIKKLGESMFGDSFEALIQFISLKDYNEILDKIDIAIFAHNRQQAMGNTINLLGRGKTIFMRSDTTSYELLTKLNISGS